MVGDPAHATGSRAGDPDGWVGVLVGPGPGIDVAIVPELALPIEGFVGRPGVHNEVMGLLKALPGQGRVGVGGVTFGRHTAYKPTEEAPLRHTIEERHLLRHAYRVVAVRQGIAQ